MELIFENYCDIIPDFCLFQEYLRKPIPTHIRINPLKIVPETLLTLLKEKGIHLESANEKYDTLYYAPGLNLSGNLLEYFFGHVHPQALTSCLTSLALSPGHNTYILDMCASPGGKTSHMSQLTDNTGLIVANELYPTRHFALGHTLDRLGVFNTVITGYQAQEFPMKHRFDYILADVPCSGEGMFRKTREGSVYRETRGKVSLPDLQKKIILRGFDLLKNQGEMIYSTCTFNPDENESVVNFLLKNRDADLLPIDVGFDYEPGVREWKDETYDKQIQRCARFYPHRINSVGFFMARIGKR